MRKPKVPEAVKQWGRSLARQAQGEPLLAITVAITVVKVIATTITAVGYHRNSGTRKRGAA